MNTLTAIEQRRAVKHYDPQYKMTTEEIDKLLGVAIKAPTAFNIQNWRLVLVQDEKLRRKIRQVSWDQAQVTDASLLIILCADLNAWQKDPQRYWCDAPQEAKDLILPAIDGYYRDKEHVQRDEAMRSCGIIAQTLMLAAKEMGYDSCPMDGFNFDAVGKLIKLPDDHVVTMFVAIGKGTKDAWPRPGQIPLNEVVINDTF